MIAVLTLLLTQTVLDPQQFVWRGRPYTMDQSDRLFFRQCFTTPPIQHGTKPRMAQIARYGWKISEDRRRITLHGPAGIPLHVDTANLSVAGSIDFRYANETPHFDLKGIVPVDIIMSGGSGYAGAVDGKYTHPPMLTFFVVGGLFSFGPQIAYADTCTAWFWL